MTQLFALLLAFPMALLLASGADGTPADTMPSDTDGAEQTVFSAPGATLIQENSVQRTADARLLAAQRRRRAAARRLTVDPCPRNNAGYLRPAAAPTSAAVPLPSLHPALPPAAHRRAISYQRVADGMTGSRAG